MTMSAASPMYTAMSAASPMYSAMSFPAQYTATPSQARRQLQLELGGTYATAIPTSTGAGFYGASAYSAAGISQVAAGAVAAGVPIAIHNREVHPAQVQMQAAVSRQLVSAGCATAVGAGRRLSVPDYYMNLMMTEIGTGNQLNTFPFHVTRILRDWLCRNLQHPYATLDEKEELRRLTGLSLHQINYWLTNARRRLVPRLLHHVNQERQKQGLDPIRKSRCKSKCKWLEQHQGVRQTGAARGGGGGGAQTLAASPPQVTGIQRPLPQLEHIGNGAVPTSAIMYSPPVTPEQSVSPSTEQRHAASPSGGRAPLACTAVSSPMVVSPPPSMGTMLMAPTKFVVLRPDAALQYHMPAVNPISFQCVGRRSSVLHRGFPSDPPPLEKILPV